VKWRILGAETTCSEAMVGRRRFTAFVSIPKGKTGRHRAASLRSRSLDRRSSRVATASYPPPRPSRIVALRGDPDNDLAWGTLLADPDRLLRSSGDTIPNSGHWTRTPDGLSGSEAGIICE